MLSNGMQAVVAGDEKGPASMSVVIADRSRLSWLTLRRRLNNLKARAKVHRVAGLVYWVAPSERLVIAPQELRTADPTRAGEIYAGRFAFAGKVVVCDGRSPFEMAPPSDEWADVAAGLRLAAPPARRRFHHHPRQCPRPGGRMDHAPGHLAPDRLAAGDRGAPDHLLAEPGDADARRRRRALLPPLPAQPDPAGALSAPHRRRHPRRRAAAAGAHRARLRGAVHGRAGRPSAQRDASGSSTSWSARSCPTAAISAAIRAP